MMTSGRTSPARRNASHQSGACRVSIGLVWAWSGLDLALGLLVGKTSRNDQTLLLA